MKHFQKNLILGILGVTALFSLPSFAFAAASVSFTNPNFYGINYTQYGNPYAYFLFDSLGNNVYQDTNITIANHEFNDASGNFTTSTASLDFSHVPVGTYTVYFVWTGFNTAQAVADCGGNQNLATCDFQINPNGSFPTAFTLGSVASTTFLFTGSSGVNPHINFSYPTQGQTTALFSPWLLTVTGLNPTANYLARISWFATYNGGTGSSTQTLTNGTFGLGSDLMQHGISIPRTDFGFDFAASTTWTATAQLFATQDPLNPGADLANPLLVTSSTITFDVLTFPQSSGQFTQPNFIYNASGTITGIGNSTTTIASQELVTASSTPTCTAPNSFIGIITSPGQDLAYGGCVVSHFLFDPNEQASQRLQGDMFTFKNVPPMSIWFNMQGVINDAITSSTNNEQNQPQYGQLTFNQSTTFLGNTPIVLISSSSLSSFIGEDAKNQLFALINAALVIIFGLYVAIRIHGRFNKNSSHFSKK